MGDKFIADAVRLTYPSCSTCKHQSKILRGACLAYPDGIPTEILLGDHDHKTAFPGDHGIRYEAINA